MRRKGLTRRLDCVLSLGGCDGRDRGDQEMKDGVECFILLTHFAGLLGFMGGLEFFFG